MTGSSAHLSNYFILASQILLICGVIVASIPFGEKFLNAWLCIVAVSMNLLVLKQIDLFGLSVTATDSLAVSYLIGLNLLQEYFGTKAARRHAVMAVCFSIGFLLLTITHNLYVPNSFDTMDAAYKTILGTMPRLCAASSITFLIVQFFDIIIFQRIRKRMSGKMLAVRVFLCVMCSQILDTVLFSVLGLYGEVESIGSIILLSIAFKTIAAFLSAPMSLLCKIFEK
jgi:uncharacterized integral membrane protein (TIGR00697 family)